MSNPSETLLEFRPVGNVMRVAAIDAATGREVIIQGPLTASRQELGRLAIAKLRYVLAKEGGHKP